MEVLRQLHTADNVEFWSDDRSHAEVDLAHVIGQLTDTYLAGLARAHGGRLATRDAGLSVALPDSTLLVPA